MLESQRLELLHQRFLVHAFVQLGLHEIVVNLSRSVEVIIRQRRHTENRAGVHIQNHARRALSGSVPGFQIREALFQIVLHGSINGGVQLTAVPGVEVLLILIEQRRAVDILRRDHHAALAGEGFVIDRLQTHGAAVFIGEANHVGSQRPKGIITLGGGLHENAVALDVIFVDEGADTVGVLLIHALFDKDILGVGLFHLLPQIVLIHIQNLREIFRNQFFVLIVFVDIQRRHEDILRRGGNGQRAAVAVVYRTAGGADGGAQRLLAHGDVLQLVVAGDLPFIELAKQQRKRDNSENRKKKQRPNTDGSIGAPRRIGCSFRFLGHGKSLPIHGHKE